MTEKTWISILQEKDTDHFLFASLERIKKKASQILQKISVVFPDYTTHTIEHKNKVIDQMNLIISEPIANTLNKYELFFLAASVYLHDIGMADLDGLSTTIVTDDKEELAEFIRNNHHIRSEEFITKYYRDLQIDDSHQAKLIGRICRGHRKENLSDIKKFDPQDIYSNSVINVPLLCSFLKLADELDLDFERTPSIAYDHLKPKNKISQKEWQKHLSIRGIVKLPTDNHIILAKAVCESEDIHKLLLGIKAKINEQLTQLPTHLHHYQEDLKEHLPKQFIFNIDTSGYLDEDVEEEFEEELFSQHLSEPEKEVQTYLQNSIRLFGEVKD